MLQQVSLEKGLDDCHGCCSESTCSSEETRNTRRGSLGGGGRGGVGGEGGGGGTEGGPHLPALHTQDGMTISDTIEVEC